MLIEKLYTQLADRVQKHIIANISTSDQCFFNVVHQRCAFGCSAQEDQIL